MSDVAEDGEERDRVGCGWEGEKGIDGVGLVGEVVEWVGFGEIKLGKEVWVEGMGRE